VEVALAAHATAGRVVKSGSFPSTDAVCRLRRDLLDQREGEGKERLYRESFLDLR
jgi:hypothetical protein